MDSTRWERVKWVDDWTRWERAKWVNDSTRWERAKWVGHLARREGAKQVDHLTRREGTTWVEVILGNFGGEGHDIRIVSDLDGIRVYFPAGARLGAVQLERLRDWCRRIEAEQLSFSTSKL